MGVVFEKGKVRERSPVYSEIAIPDVPNVWGLLFLTLAITIAPARFLFLVLSHFLVLVLFFLVLVVLVVLILRTSSSSSSNSLVVSENIT
jgi:membrane protein implicated in regulation of membrane protease activity